MRLVRRRQVRALLDAIAECEDVAAEHRATGQPASMGLAQYEHGLRTAAMILGVVPPGVWR